ncbi:uncharacterized protein LOC108093916 [Drosophila ficusphila]|uniref:uncharacterized protein LOC108093916 n=1 Tax=Drosophila ficusphila TaxID=30025 RepID=UPI0007E60AB6|nr:uncharacterized protein LOC108093916 [Drosophila ficusphila]
MMAKLFSAVLSILLLNLVNSAPTSSATYLVPSINDNGVILMPSDHGYYLRIDIEGTGREENVEVLPSGLLQVKGSFGQPFPRSRYLLVTYEAGPNGYVAKYNLSELQNTVQQLPAMALKSAAG